MAMTGGPSATTNPQPNVTPLIDVLLTLLVIFMVITPISPKGENAMIPRPEDTVAASQPRTVVVVQLIRAESGEPELKINQEAVAWSALLQRLTDIYKLRAERVMFVSADDGVLWSYVAAVVGTAHAAGVDKIGLMASRSETGVKLRF